MLFPWSNNLPNAPRLFTPPQSEVNLFQSLPYTLALRTTRAQSSSAMNRRRGTRNTRLSLRESTERFTPKPRNNISVPGGSDVKDVQTGTTTPTSAQDVALPLMELTTVLRCRGLWVQTPYEPDAWKQVLVLADFSALGKNTWQTTTSLEMPGSQTSSCTQVSNTLKEGFGLPLAAYTMGPPRNSMRTAPL